VAILAAAFAGLAFATHKLGAGAVIAAVMAAVLIVVAATDIERRIIPNRIVLPATAFVLVVRVAFFPETSLEFILAALGASFVFLVPILINPSLMGMGDVKLVMLLGAGLGAGVIGATTIACMCVFPVAVVILLRGGLAARKTTLAFGPFLALGGLVILFVPHFAGLA
jgi:prepilin signal peptidase PulO-like enzyme (type II secretory pathway)